MTNKVVYIIFSPPERADLCFTADVYVFVRHGISELCRPINTKFCTVVCSKLSFKN